MYFKLPLQRYVGYLIHPGGYTAPISLAIPYGLGIPESFDTLNILHKQGLVFVTSQIFTYTKCSEGSNPLFGELTLLFSNLALQLVYHSSLDIIRYLT